MEYILVALIGYYFDRRYTDKSSGGRQSSNDTGNKKRIIRAFLTSFQAKNTSKQDQIVIDKMVEELEQTHATKTVQAAAVSETMATTVEHVDHTATDDAPSFAAPKSHVQKVPIDNTSLLLYFGAFLFITSMGLFVGFSDTHGTVKTISIALVSLILYGGGLKLHKEKKQLEQVGIAFVGIGMAVAPLIGLAAYSYVFDQTNGPVIWLATSVAVFALYVHALYVLKNTVVSYLLIFSFVSIFESAISVIDAPIHYFAWGLALAGMTLKIVSMYVNAWKELKDPAYTSALLLIILNMAASLILIGNEGLGQFCISLAFTCIYSAFELYTTDTRRAEHYFAVHVLGLVTVAVTTYYFFKSLPSVALALTAVTLLETFVIWLYGKGGPVMRIFASISLGAALISIAFAVERGSVLFGSIASLIVLSLSIAYKQKRIDAYAVAAVAGGALPVIYGQLVAPNQLTITQQTVLSLVSLVPNGLFMLHTYHEDRLQRWREAAEMLFVLMAGFVLVMSTIGESSLVIYTAAAIAISMVYIAHRYTRPIWATVAGLVLFISLISVSSRSSEKVDLLIAASMALAGNVLMAIHFRNTANRWISTMCWLIYPVAVGSTNTPKVWTAEMYAWSYVFVTYSLIVSRGIALGKILPSARSSVESLTKHASSAYIYGAAVSGTLPMSSHLVPPKHHYIRHSWQLLLV